MLIIEGVFLFLIHVLSNQHVDFKIHPVMSSVFLLFFVNITKALFKTYLYILRLITHVTLPSN
jgi:hypothetical protein